MRNRAWELVEDLSNNGEHARAQELEDAINRYEGNSMTTTPIQSRGPAAPHARTDPSQFRTEIPSGLLHRFQRFVDEPADRPGTDIRFLYNFHLNANMLQFGGIK